MITNLQHLEKHLENLRCSVDAVDAQIRDLQAKKEAISSEVREVEVAVRVLTRITNVHSHGQHEVADVDPVTTSSDRPTDIPTMPEMIRKVLSDFDGPLEPKQIADTIAVVWWPNVIVNSVASTCWRMWKQGKLEKDEGSSAYRLPKRDEPPDGKLDGDTSEGSLFETTAKGREAVPGGGP